MLSKNQITALTATKAKQAYTAPFGEVTAVGPTLTVWLHGAKFDLDSFGKVDTKALCSGLIMSIDESRPPLLPQAEFETRGVPFPPLYSTDYPSPELARGALCGVHTNGKAFCATDGHRLVTTAKDGISGWTLPIEFIKLAYKLKIDRYQTLSEGYVSFNFDGGLVIAKTLDGPYPRYQNVLPHTFEFETAIPEAKVWDEAAKKLKALGSRTLGVDSKGYALGADYRHIKVMEPWHDEAWGDNLRAFNAKYMAQLLKGVTKPVLKNNGPLVACVCEHEGEIRLIMPLRIVD